MKKAKPKDIFSYLYRSLTAAAVPRLIALSVVVFGLIHIGRMRITQSNVQMVDLDELIGDDEEGNIFFVESDDALTEFHPRLLCAFESAAMHNPDKRVSKGLRHVLCKMNVVGD